MSAIPHRRRRNSRTPAYNRTGIDYSDGTVGIDGGRSSYYYRPEDLGPHTIRRLQMQTITPCLWFDGKAEEAATFYTSLLPDSHIDKVYRAPGNYPSGKAGDVLTVEFTLMGHPFVGLNGGPHFKFNEAVSFQIPVDTQAEIARLTNALPRGPGAERCGWFKDRYGLSWQIVPRRLPTLLSDANPARAKRAFESMMQMKRIDIAALERAADGLV